jgi:hypothetical protein
MVKSPHSTTRCEFQVDRRGPNAARGPCIVLLGHTMCSVNSASNSWSANLLPTVTQVGGPKREIEDATLIIMN